jgi:hypothetical protein
LASDISAVTVAAGVCGLAAAGQGITASQHQVPAGMTLRLHMRTTGGGSRSERHRGFHGSGDSWSRGLNSGRSVRAGGTCVGGSAHAIGTISCSHRRLLTGGCQRLAALKCEFATRKSCHVRPRVSS